MEIERGVTVAVTGGVLIGRGRAGILVEAAVTFGHLKGHLAALAPFLLLGELVIYLSISFRSIEILAACHLVVGGGKFRSAARHGRKGKTYDDKKSDSFHNYHKVTKTHPIISPIQPVIMPPAPFIPPRRRYLTTINYEI